MRKFFALVLTCVLLPAALWAGTSADRMVAVVNDQIITLNQLKSRVQLMSRQMGAQASEIPEHILYKKVLSEMIDEELQRQFAATAGVKVAPDELAKAKAAAIDAVGGPAAWKKLTGGVEASATAKLEGEVLWQKIMAREIAPRVNVGSLEIDRLIGELSKNKTMVERQLSAIQMTVDKDRLDADVLAKITDARAQIAKGTAFEELAKALSDDKSAANGGKLGWFASGELPAPIEEALKTMKKGDVSQPIKTPEGWYLVRVDNIHEQQAVEMQPQQQAELFLLAHSAVSSTTDLVAIEKNLEAAAKATADASAVKAAFEKKAFDATLPESKALGFVSMQDLQPALRTAVEKTKPGSWSKTLKLGEGANALVARVFVASTRKIMPRQLEELRGKVAENLSNSRGELAARKFMRELRQKAFLDVRL